MHGRFQTGLLIFLLIGLVYFISAKGSTEITDTYFSLQTSKAIIENHSLAAEGCRGGYCHKSEKDGKYYSKYGIGLALIFIPYTLLGKGLALLAALPKEKVTDFLLSFYNIFFGAGAGVIMFYTARHFGNSKRASLAMALLLCFGTFCWRYSVWDFSEPAQMFFLFLCAYCALKNDFKHTTAGALSFSFLLLLKAQYLFYLPLFFIYIIMKNKDDAKTMSRRLLIFFSIIGAAFCFMLLLNYVRFGELFEFGYGAEARNFYLPGIAEHAPKLLYWLDKGIFIYNPVFILGALGYFSFFRKFRKEAAFFASIIAANFILTSAWYGWHGCSCWGPRLLVPAAPFWLIPCFCFFHKKGIAKALLVAIVSLSACVQVISILQGNLEYLIICNANGQEGVRKGMPAQITGSLIMLKHKLEKKDSSYSLREFGADSDNRVDTSVYGYKGFDFWFVKAAGFFGMPILNFTPLLLMPLIIACLWRLLKIL